MQNDFDGVGQEHKLYSAALAMEFLLHWCFRNFRFFESIHGSFSDLLNKDGSYSVHEFVFQN